MTKIVLFLDKFRYVPGFFSLQLVTFGVMGARTKKQVRPAAATETETKNRSDGRRTGHRGNEGDGGAGGVNTGFSRAALLYSNGPSATQQKKYEKRYARQQLTKKQTAPPSRTQPAPCACLGWGGAWEPLNYLEMNGMRMKAVNQSST